MKFSRMIVAAVAVVAFVATVLYAAYPYVYVASSTSLPFSVTFPGHVTSIQCLGPDADADVAIMFKTGTTNVAKFPSPDGPSSTYRTFAGIPFNIEWNPGASYPDSVVVIVVPAGTTDYEVLAR